MDGIKKYIMSMWTIIILLAFVVIVLGLKRCG